MKKLKYLCLALLVAITLTGCAFDSKKDEDTKKTEEKVSKKNKKENKENKKENKENKKENKKENRENKKVDPVVPSNTDELVCHLNNESGSVDVNIIWTNSTITNINFVVAVAIPEEMDESTYNLYGELVSQTLQSTYGIGEDTEGITLTSSVDKDNKKVVFDFKFDLTKADSTLLSTFGFDFTEENLKETVEQVKASIIADGYTCD